MGAQLLAAIVVGGYLTFAKWVIADYPSPLFSSAEEATRASSLTMRTPLEFKGRIFVTVTGYSSDPAQTDDTPFITAANTAVRDGVVAANFLSFGTKIMIPELYGRKVFIVEDRMNRRYNREARIDLWFSNYARAKTFGVRSAAIIIL